MNYYRLILSGRYRETSVQTRGLVSVARSEGFKFDNFYLRTEALIHKKKVSKILIECRQDFTPGVFSGLEEIRERIEVLKAAGKEVYFYASSYGVAELFLASACSFRLIHPMGRIKFHGLSHSFLFAQRGARRIGIGAEIFRRGEFKSAGDRFRTDQLEAPNRRQYEDYLCSVMNRVRTAVADGFDKTADDLLLLEGDSLNAETAADGGWIDEVVTGSAFIKRWQDQDDKEVKFKKTPSKAGGGLFRREKQVAVLIFEGAIIDGHSKRDPLLGQAVGSDSFIPEIRKLRDDKKVKAVVLRINSGGGSAFASEDVTSELRLLAEEKPLVVSMSEIAASGGYWMSCCGRRTFAMASTLTGSIGVISIYLSWYRLLDKLGVTHDTIRQGEHADAGLPLRPLSEREREMVDVEIGEMYSSFLKTAAAHRGKTEDDIDALGRGRIWSGADAADRELVDEIGGLSDALRFAASEASVANPVVRFYPEVKHGLLERLVMNFRGEEDESLESAAVLTGLTGLISGRRLKTGPLAVAEEMLFKWN